jgi:hypothetical protein
MIQVILHLSNSEPIKVDVDELPDQNATNITCKNPRDKSDREVNWIEEGVSTVIFPMWRVNYIQVLPSDDDRPEFPLPFRND